MMRCHLQLYLNFPSSPIYKQVAAKAFKSVRDDFKALVKRPLKEVQKRMDVRPCVIFHHQHCYRWDVNMLGYEYVPLMDYLTDHEQTLFSMIQ